MIDSLCHLLGTDEALSRGLKMDLACGLTDLEARTRLTAHGPNEMPQAPFPSSAVILSAMLESHHLGLDRRLDPLGPPDEWIDTAAILSGALLNPKCRTLMKRRPGNSWRARLSTHTAP